VFREHHSGKPDFDCSHTGRGHSPGRAGRWATCVPRPLAVLLAQTVDAAERATQAS
jgi:hypothetical protein